MASLIVKCMLCRAETKYGHGLTVDPVKGLCIDGRDIYEGNMFLCGECNIADSDSDFDPYPSDDDDILPLNEEEYAATIDMLE